MNAEARRKKPRRRDQAGLRHRENIKQLPHIWCLKEKKKSPAGWDQAGQGETDVRDRFKVHEQYIVADTGFAVYGNRHHRYQFAVAELPPRHHASEAFTSPAADLFCFPPRRGTVEVAGREKRVRLHGSL